MTTAKILIIEDDLNLLATLKYNLLKEGHGVITVADGA
jgi:DNA-binding response OmpR family regulator